MLKRAHQRIVKLTVRRYEAEIAELRRELAAEVAIRDARIAALQNALSITERLAAANLEATR